MSLYSICSKPDLVLPSVMILSDYAVQNCLFMLGRVKLLQGEENVIVVKSRTGVML